MHAAYRSSRFMALRSEAGTCRGGQNQSHATKDQPCQLLSTFFNCVSIPCQNAFASWGLENLVRIRREVKEYASASLEQTPHK